MSPNDKILHILKQLLEKSRRSQVNWRKVGKMVGIDLKTGSSIPEWALNRYEEYYVDLANATITLQYRKPLTEVDQIQVRVEEPRGHVLWQMTFEEGAANWALALDVFQEARRMTLGIDKILVDIENAVNSEGTVGR